MRGTYELSAVVLSNIVLKEPVLWSYWVGIVCVVLAIVLIARLQPDM